MQVIVRLTSQKKKSGLNANYAMAEGYGQLINVCVCVMGISSLIWSRRECVVCVCGCGYYNHACVLRNFFSVIKIE